MNIAVIFFIFFVWIAIVVGICALFVWICKKIAESKGLPSSYMWFGLLGVIGIIIVAVMGPSYPQYPQYPPQNGQNPYQQNTFSEIIHTSSLNNHNSLHSNKVFAHIVEHRLMAILLLAAIVDKC